MTTRRVTLATYEKLPDLTDDDRALAAALERRGVRVAAGVWSEPSHWACDPGLVVLRSCWDYHLRLPEFLAWLDGLDAHGVPVRNPVAAIRWNARKRYLLDLAARGIATLPTVLVPYDGTAALGTALAALAADDGALWRDVVIKPEVSASAYLTVRVRAPHDAASLRGFETLPAGSRLLVQPYAASVAELGETSLVFLGGRFSHAVSKRPASGDFRVQAELGGSSHAVAAAPALVAWGERVLAEAGAASGVAPGALAYARVDALPEDPPRLMELELIEPALFLAHDAGAAGRFADAVARCLTGAE
jgi:hypothetical protein